MGQDEARQQVAAPMSGENQLPRQFWSTWQDLSAVYERYARLQGLSFTSLSILDEVYRAHLSGTDCTQKSICSVTFLPKQTANSVIAGFVRDGLVELVELPHDRRAKAIRLTERGAAYAQRIIEPIDNAEVAAFAQFTVAEREQFLATLERYAASCAAQLNSLERATVAQSDPACQR